MADVKQYIVEYLVQANVQNAVQNLSGLTGMMEEFQAKYGAGLRQSSVAADRILKSAKNLGKNLGKQLDMSGPIAQMQAFQGQLISTFNGAHKVISSMFAGDMNAMNKAINGLATSGFRSEQAMKRIRGEAKGTSQELRGLAREMKESQQSFNTLSSFMQRLGNAKVGKGDKAKWSKAALKSFTEDEQKMIAKIGNDKSWMGVSGQRLEKIFSNFDEELKKRIARQAAAKKAYEDYRAKNGTTTTTASTVGAITGNPLLMSSEEMDKKVASTRKMVRSMSKLIAEQKGKPKVITYTATLNIEDAVAKLNTLQEQFTKLQSMANISVRVRGAGAAKGFKGYLDDINKGVKDLQTTLSTVATTPAKKAPKAKKIGKNEAVEIPAKLVYNTADLKGRLSKMKLTVPVTLVPTLGDKATKTKNLEAFKTKIPPVKIKVDLKQARAKFDEFIAHIQKFRNQTINLNATAGSRYRTGRNGGGTTVQPPGGGVGGTTTQPSTGRKGPVGQRTYGRGRGFSTYPLVGNTSFGVQTPAFVGMAKGMVGMMGIGAAFGLIGDAMRQAVEYQNTMASVKAILESNQKLTGYTPASFRAMEKNIRRVGMDTKFTAPEVAGAARFMAMAGLSVDQINNSIRPIADVALIGDNDLQTTADKITNIQTAFGLGKDPKQMRKLADNLTTTFTRFNTDMMMTAEAMQYAAPIASAAGLGIEETLAMIGVMGNAGIQSSMAGTTLRMALQNVINPNKKQKKLWDAMGIQRFNKDGSVRNIVDVLSDLSEHSDDKNLVKLVSNMFRVTSMAGVTQIIRNLEKVKATRDDMKLGLDSGISERLSLEKQNTVAGLWAQVTSAFTEDNVQMFEKFQGSLKEMLISIRDYLKTPEAAENLNNIMELVKTMGSAFGTVAKIWLDIYNTFPGAVKAMMVMQFALNQIGLLLNPFIGLYRVLRNMGLALGAIGAGNAVAGAASGAVGLRGAFAAAKAAGSFGAIGSMAGGAMTGLGTAIGGIAGAVASPVGLAILGIATTVGLIYKDIKDKDNAVKKFNEKAKETQSIRDNASGIINNTLTDNMLELGTKTGSIVNVGQIMNEKGKPVVGRKWISNPMFRHTRGYSQLFDADMMKHAPLEYVKSIYDQFVAPATGGSYSFENFRRDAGFGVPQNMGKVGYITNSTKNAQAIAARYAMTMDAVNSSDYTGARDRILKLFGRAASIEDKDKRIEAFKNARTSAMKIIDAYRPGSNNESIRNMTGEQIGNMSAARRYNSFEFKYAIVENLTDMLNGEDNPVMQKYLAIEQLDQLADNEVAKRVYWLQRSVGGITFTGINMEDQMVQLNLQIHDGQLSFQEYLAKIQAFKLKVSDTVGSFLLLSLQAAKLAAANGDLPEGVTIDSLGANMGGFSVGSKLSKEQSQWLKEKGQAYALENGIDPAQFSLTNGSKSKQKKDIDAVVSWYRKRMGLNFEDTNKGNGGNNGKTNSLTNNNGGNNRSTNPYQIDQSGYKNQYQRPTARPTQIVFNIENLCNFDKNEFLTADEKEVANQIMPRVIHAVTQAVATAQTQIGAMPDAGNGSQV